MAPIRLALAALCCAAALVGAESLVDDGFARARRGDYSALPGLVSLGPSAAPDVRRYLQDPSLVLRIDALDLLEAYRACEELRGALTNNAAEVRGRAALAFFRACGRRDVDGAVATALRESIHAGSPSPVALMLLGEAGDSESAAVLRERRRSSTVLKWHLDSQPVAESLVASLALVRHGGEAALVDVRRALARPTVAEARFFMDALPFIDDRGVLETLSRRLSDTRPLPNEPRRRVCDYAAKVFADRFGLVPSFAARDYGRYSDVELEELKRAVSARLST